MGKTSIEWTGFSWNPIRGTKGRHTCVRISPGCKNCYAAQMNRRGLGMEPLDYVAGADVPRVDDEALVLPLRWRKPRKIFVCSMTDLFWDAIPDEAIDRVLAVMMLAPHHTFQVLTKRAQRMRDYFRAPNLYQRILDVADHELRPQRRHLGSIGISNPADAAFRRWIWLGVSVEDQERADERIPLLLQTPTAVRWVSYEPALGPVDFRPWVSNDFLGVNDSSCGLDWIVVGGESGPGARPFDVAWARGVLKECAPTPCRVFVKQLGANVECIDVVDAADYFPGDVRLSAAPRPNARVHLKNRKGGTPEEWPADLRVREFPGGGR